MNGFYNEEKELSIKLIAEGFKERYIDAFVATDKKILALSFMDNTFERALEINASSLVNIYFDLYFFIYPNAI